LALTEAHFARRLVRTARWVAELQDLTEPDLRVPPLQVVETTATPDGAVERSVAVIDDDFDADDALHGPLTQPKPVRIVELPAWLAGRDGKARDAAVAKLADEVVHLRGEVPDGTIGCDNL
jgi:CRISPR-associated endonuclease/helicase Cas3